MTAKQLFQAGKVAEAIQALNAQVRDNPTDSKSRTFLFELLCFAGEYDRAEKQVNILSQDNKQAGLGAVLYLSALHAERLRQDMFQKKDFPTGEPAGGPFAGTLNGKPFESIEDGDPRIGPRLEVYAAGAYLWIPFAHVEYIELQEPKRLRDLLWIPALVRTGPAFKGVEMGEVLLPVLCPGSAKSADGQIQLGRKTEWVEGDGGEQVPIGQKTLLVDGEDISLLEVRKIEFAATPAQASEQGAAGD